MNKLKITVSNEDFIAGAVNLVANTNRFNEHRINSSYLSLDLVRLVMQSISTEFIYQKLPNLMFSLNIFCNSELIKNLVVSVASVSSFYAELLGTNIFYNNSEVKYINVIEAEFMSLSFYNNKGSWDISLTIDSSICE